MQYLCIFNKIKLFRLGYACKVILDPLLNSPPVRNGCLSWNFVLHLVLVKRLVCKLIKLQYQQKISIYMPYV